jgi:phospholipid/cholesterol/gamma-HCH transport system substrate-binding protein
MKIAREVKIGLVAVLAVCVAIWGINFLKGINVFGSTDHYYAVYGNVKGLSENALVTINGYKVGSVKKIEFDNTHFDRIVIEISLEKKISLRHNTALVIKSGSLISGTRDIEIIPGDGTEFYASGDTLPGIIQPDITDFIDPIRKNIESVITSIDTVMVAFGNLMDYNTRKNLQGTIANLNGATESLKASLQPSGAISQTFYNLGQITDNLKKSNEDISKMLNNLSDVSDSLKQAELKALISNASETFASTAEIFSKINSGQGTAGQLIANDSVYRNLNSAIVSLDSLLTDLREHPKRYVQLSVFGKKDK